jgi:hypothetical protein
MHILESISELQHVHSTLKMDLLNTFNDLLEEQLKRNITELFLHCCQNTSYKFKIKLLGKASIKKNKFGKTWHINE